jgi:hypothetical protein
MLVDFKNQSIISYIIFQCINKEKFCSKNRRSIEIKLHKICSSDNR